MVNQRPQQTQTLFEQIVENSTKYIGSISPVKEQQWIYTKEKINTDESDSLSVVKGHMIQKVISYMPGLYRMINEILMNAVEN